MNEWLKISKNDRKLGDSGEVCQFQWNIWVFQQRDMGSQLKFREGGNEGKEIRKRGEVDFCTFFDFLSPQMVIPNLGNRHTSLPTFNAGGLHANILPIFWTDGQPITANHNWRTHKTSCKAHLLVKDIWDSSDTDNYKYKRTYLSGYIHVEYYNVRAKHPTSTWSLSLNA